MKIKMLITTLAMFLLLSVNGLMAQPPQSKNLQESKQRIESLKRAYIIEETKMTPDESSKFWPLFEEYNDKRRAIKSDGGSGSDADRERADLKDEYYQKYLAIMPKEKVNAVMKAIKEFRRQIVNEIK